MTGRFALVFHLFGPPLTRVPAAQSERLGLIRIRDDGMVEVTDRAEESAAAPGHPVPGALLAALGRQGNRFR